ncbi:hypothetical protein ABFT80_01485 [Mesorhizobium sp. SB112]|uniref:D-apionate lactonase n=1 Tax=Mesorhizobium sp. SB112 TaxID=3151853 RepID=UPI0032646B6D
MTHSSDFLLFGTEEKKPEAKRLQAGDLSVELIGGNVRSIRFADVEILRSIAFLVRDRDWGTCDPVISDLDIAETKDGFSVSYKASFEAPSGALLNCEAKIEGKPASVLFDASFTPQGDFETARAGFAVLHPVVGVAGKPVRVTHSDGSIEHTTFPDLIEPWQPFKDISAIEHEPLPGLRVECRMDGDVFEMEDQRNWTDGSYKTYVRPLALPWPYLLKSGETIRQSITLTVANDASTTSAKDDGKISLTLLDSDVVLPEISIGLRPEELVGEREHANLLKEIGARHLICHFDPTAHHGVDTLAGFRDIAEASELAVTLECFVPCQEAPLDEELSAIASQVKGAGLSLSSIAVSPSMDRQSTPPGSKWPECPPLENVYTAAKRAFPGIPLGGGMFSYFTELNRKRVPSEQLAYITHATCPIVHAADDLSVMQTFEALRFVTRSVRAIYGEKPYRIGPSTIAMRQNPYGSATKENPSRKRIAMANVDPRHNGLFGAAWTLAYAATVAEAGLDVVTLSTLAGPFGLVAGKNEPVAEGKPRPLFHVLKWLGHLSGADYLAVNSPEPEKILALGARRDGKTVLLVANLTPHLQNIEISGVRGGLLSLLDEVWLQEGGGEPVLSTLRADELELPPYAVARLEL